MSQVDIYLSSLDPADGQPIAGADGTGGIADFNGDGFEDLVFSRDPVFYRPFSEVIVGFGSETGHDLTTLDGTGGFTIRVNATIRSVTDSGDVNGDGFDDILIGTEAGHSFVVFGRAEIGSRFSADHVNGRNGFRIDGYDGTGSGNGQVAFAGDVNGDGFDDILVGGAGEAFVVFGQAAGFAASIDVATLDGSNGFRITGLGADGFDGIAVASAGDVNGDGYGDFIVAADGATGTGSPLSGESHVVFGSASGFPATVDVATLDGTNGFRFEGLDYGDRSGHSVASAGDVNGDGYDDIVIGAFGADPLGPLVNRNAGESYVVFGSASGFPASLSPDDLDGTNGFRINGILENDMSGFTVASAGDFNGDGHDDILIGTGQANTVYIVFGSGAGFPASIDLAGLDGIAGLTIHGGGQAFGGGDLNGDGFDDIVIGQTVIYGRSTAPGPAVPVGRAVDGTDADDSLVGGSGNDTLDGRSGADLMLGGLGDDVYHIDHADDRVVEVADEGFDTVFSSVSLGLNRPNDPFANIERFVLTGTATQIIGNDGVQTMVGNDLDNHLRGNGGNDTLEGAGGNDVLVGGTGDDDMRGGEGDDAYFVDSAGDTVLELAGEGIDRVFSSIDYTLGAHVEDLRLFGAQALVGTGNAGDNLILAGQGPATLYGLAGNDTLVGSHSGDLLDGGAGDDALTGGFGDDEILGGLGNDVLIGGTGNDTLSGGADDDRLRGEEGNDSLRGGDGNDHLHGGIQADELHGDAGDDCLFGDEGRDVLHGGDGADMLVGGAGRDTMTGGTGADDFLFDIEDFSGTTLTDSDLITDFSQADGDTIRLNRIDAVPGGTDSAFLFVGDAAFSRTAGELRFEIVGNHTLVQGDIDGDAVADFAIVLAGQIDLVADDFLL